jgi:U3 small nucleolar RNA-associated protein 25
MPALKESALFQTHTCIVVPSYFDFVRVKNWFEKSEISYAALSEYTSNDDVSRARTEFCHGRDQFLIITERFHFFRRYG